MKLSVLMITYNHERYIREALDGVLMQEVDFDYEIVVGEDCSKDATRAILLEYAARYPGKFRLLLREKNMGAVNNFWATLLDCKGQYVALLEGDDYWTSPQKLKKQIAFLDSHHDYVGCFHNVTGHFEDNSKPDFSYVRPDSNDTVTLEDLLVENVIPTCSMVFRQGLIEPLPSWIYKLPMGDYPLHILNAQFGKIGYFDEFMGIYRVHSGGIWTGLDWLARLQGTTRMVELLMQTLKGPNRKSARLTLARKYWDHVGEYEIRGEHRTARRYALMSLRKGIFTGSPSLRHKTKIVARVFSPGLYRRAQEVYDSVARSNHTLQIPLHAAVNKPRVSFVIPAYNAQRYLVQAVHSVLMQTFSDFECIVVDDGSTDRTSNLLSDLAVRDGRVRPMRIPHGGIVEALNAGINAARAELIARMDADDICMPERLARQVAYMDEHPECVAVGSQVTLVDPFNSTLWNIEVKTEHDQIEAELFRGNGWALFHPTALLRRQAMLDVGGYRPQYQWSEDMDLFLRLGEIGRLANMTEALLRYRQHFASVNRTKLEIQLRRSERVVIDAYRRRGKAMPPDFKLDTSPQLTRYEQIRAWCQRAIMTRNLYAARRHALVALRSEPLRYDSWSLMYHAIAGR